MMLEPSCLSLFVAKCPVIRRSSRPCFGRAAMVAFPALWSLIGRVGLRIFPRRRSLIGVRVGVPFLRTLFGWSVASRHVDAFTMNYSFSKSLATACV